VFEAAAKEAAENVARNVATKAAEEGVVHLTTPAAAEAIEQSGKLGGRWGLFGLEAGKVPSSAIGRNAVTLVPGALSGEVRIGAEAANVFARGPRFGVFSTWRYYAGVRTTPLGSLSLTTGEFLAGEIFRNGAFRTATRAEYGLQLAHQWLLDYGIDALIYTGVKTGTSVSDEDTKLKLWFNWGDDK
jgi:hypothetical protein